MRRDVRVVSGARVETVNETVVGVGRLMRRLHGGDGISMLPQDHDEVFCEDDEFCRGRNFVDCNFLALLMPEYSIHA